MVSMSVVLLMYFLTMCHAALGAGLQKFLQNDWRMRVVTYAVSLCPLPAAVLNHRRLCSPIVLGQFDLMN